MPVGTSKKTLRNWPWVTHITIYTMSMMMLYRATHRTVKILYRATYRTVKKNTKTLLVVSKEVGRRKFWENWL